MSNFNQFFDVTTWFGAAPDESGNPMRYLNATLSNMYVKFEEYEDTADCYTISYNANGGVVSPKTVLVEKGYVLDSLPTTTRENYVFNGWNVNGVSIKLPITIYSNLNITANWSKDLSLIEFNQ